MNIENFDQLLAAARAQPIPQRLLFVFATAELPDDASARQRADFAAGEGGALVPSMMVDRAPEELTSFAALVEEAAQFSKDWQVVLVAALSSDQPADLSNEVVAQALQTMVEQISKGELMKYLPLGRDGNSVTLYK